MHTELRIKYRQTVSVSVKNVSEMQVTRRRKFTGALQPNCKKIHPNSKCLFTPTEGIKDKEQECIPVGCVPAARRPYAGVCFPGGGSVRSGGGGVCLVRGRGVVCQVWGGCLRSGGWGVPGRGGGVSGPGWGCAWSGGVCAWFGGDTTTPSPLWTEWQTGVKILPWPQLRCGR